MIRAAPQQVPFWWFLYERYEFSRTFEQTSENPSFRRIVADAAVVGWKLDIRTFRVIAELHAA